MKETKTWLVIQFRDKASEHWHDHSLTPDSVEYGRMLVDRWGSARPTRDYRLLECKLSEEVLHASS